MQGSGRVGLGFVQWVCWLLLLAEVYVFVAVGRGGVTAVGWWCYGPGGGAPQAPSACRQACLIAG